MRGLMTPDRIRQWLLQNPRPSMVRVQTLSGEVHMVACAPNCRWASVAATIAALDPATIQALGEGEEVLRAERCVPGEVTSSPSLSGPELPRASSVAIHSMDPQVQLMSHFANLLADAYRDSNAMQLKMFELMSQRTESIERRLERTESAYQAEFRARVETQLQNVEDDDLRSEMMRVFFSSAGGPRAATPPAPNANGHTPPPAPKGWS